jgi:hypothetical protein
VGVVTFEDNRILSQFGSAPPVDGPYLVLPDGLVKSHGFRVANASGKSLSSRRDDGFEVDTHRRLDIASSHQFTFYLLPIGRGMLADAMTFVDGSRQGFAIVDPANGRVGRFQRLEASLAEVPFTLRPPVSDEQIDAALEGLRAIFDNHPLVAAYYLRDLPMEVHGTAHGANLRRMELIAAAGLGPWMRAELIAGKRGIEADGQYYLARSYAYEGNWGAVEAHAGRAYELFSSWPPQARELGRGRVDLLAAMARAERGDLAGAHSYALRSVHHFAQTKDRMMEATALQWAGLYRFGLGDIDEGTSLIQRAFQTFEAGGAPYHGLLARFRLGRSLTEAGHFDAGKVLTEVGASFEALGEPIAMNRGHIAAVTLEVRRSGSRHLARLIPELFQIALDQGDRIGAMAAATLLIEERLTETEQDILRAGLALTMGLVTSNETYYVRPARRALMTLCTRGLPASVESSEQGAPLVQACDGIRRSLRADRDAIPIWLDSGYRHLQMSRWEASRAIASALNDLLSPEFIAEHGRLAADILLFQAALAYAQERDAQDLSAISDEQTMVALIQRAFNILKETLALDEAPAYLFETGQQFRLRGLEQLTLAFFRAAIQAASNAGQSELVASYTLALAEAHLESEDWKALIALRPPPHPGFARRIHLLQAHARFMAQDTSAAMELRARALEDSRKGAALQHLASLVLAAQLDLSRGDLAACEELLREAVAIEEALGSSDAPRDHVRVLAARSRSLRARWHVRREQLTEAREAIGEAVAIISEIPADVAAHVRIEILEDAGTVARSEAEVAHYVEMLQLLKTQISVADGGRVRQAAIASQARLEAHRGRHAEAYALLRELLEDGLAPGPSRQSTDCLMGELALGAGKQRNGLAALERCARHDTVGERGARARIWLAFNDPRQTTAFRVGLVQHLERIMAGRGSARDRERLTLIRLLPQPTSLSDRALEQRLRNRLDSAAHQGAEDEAAAVEALTNYLLATGQAREAEDLLNRHGSVFFDAGEESEGTLVRLRLAALVQQLRPFEARTFGERAMAESAPMTLSTRTSIALFMVKNYIVLGQWFEAARVIDEGIALAREAEDVDAEQSFVSLADRFGLTPTLP